MLITRETDYALRILRALSDGQQRSITEICRKEATPRQFAYRIIKKLEKMHWIEIFRGVEGVCRLTADLHTISLFELINGIGSERDISACLKSGYTCSKKETCDADCFIRPGLVKIQKTLDDELKRHSIYSLLFGESK